MVQRRITAPPWPTDLCVASDGPPVGTPWLDSFARGGTAADWRIEHEIQLESENFDLRGLLAQAGLDAVEQKALMGLQRLLLEELHHRSKNSLAVVMGITSITLKAAESLEAGRLAIAERLMALGRAQDLLLQTNWSSAPLSTILSAAVAPFDNRVAGRFSLPMSAIEVGSESVLPLALVLNELCTNAVKHGALSNDSGRVEITAIADQSEQAFRLIWKERDGPAVREPSRRSFGMKLIEGSFIDQMDEGDHLTFDPAGVVCVLKVPMGLRHAQDVS